MANVHRIIQNLSRINTDTDKLITSFIDLDQKLCTHYIDNHHHFNKTRDNNNKNGSSQKSDDDLMKYLKEEKTKLLSIGVQFNNHNNHQNKPIFHQKCSTPNHFSKSKPRYSSTKKIRPKIRKTPLRPLMPINIANVNNINNNNNNNHNHHTNDYIKIPQKKLTLSHLNANKNINNVQNINIVKNSNIIQPKNGVNQTGKEKMDIDIELNNDNDNDNDSESDNDENILPLNLMSANSKSMVQQKLEQNKLLKKSLKPKPNVDALQKAKLKRLEQEKREKERKRQKEIVRKTIEENKRKKKLAEQEKHRQQQMKHSQAGLKKKLTNNKNIKHHKHNKNIKNMPNLKKTKFKIQPNNIKKKQSLNQAKMIKKKKGSSPEPTEYAISEYDSDFSDSDLDEEHCGKYIPVWARKSNPKQSIKRQQLIDPDTIFGRMSYKSCDLEVLFKDYPSRTKYRQRSASGDWTKDQISWSEENVYKKSMGWI